MWLVETSEGFNTAELKDSFGLLSQHSVVNDDMGRMYYLASDKTIKVEGQGTISHGIQTDILDKISSDALTWVRSKFVGDYHEIMWSLPIESSYPNKTIVFKEGVWLIIDVGITSFEDIYYEA